MFAPWLLLLAITAVAPAPCPPGERAIVIRTADRALWLCKDGQAVARHRVAIGAGGVDKRRQGDRKTPLGRYTLAPPRRSSSFGTFIGIGYPTPAQVRRGFTGNAVGIHGPPRGRRGAAAIEADWTDGCVALATDAGIEAVARWVTMSRVRTVLID